MISHTHVVLDFDVWGARAIRRLKHRWRRLFFPTPLLPGPRIRSRIARISHGISRSIASPRCGRLHLATHPATRHPAWVCERLSLYGLCRFAARRPGGAPLGLSPPPRFSFFVAHGGQSHSESDSRQIEIEIGTPPFCSFPSFLSVEPVCETESCVFF